MNLSSTLKNFMADYSSRRPMSSLCHIVPIRGQVDRVTIKTRGQCVDSTIEVAWLIDHLPPEGAMVDASTLRRVIGRSQPIPNAEYIAGDCPSLVIAGARLSVIVVECWVGAVATPEKGFDWPMEKSYARGEDIAAAAKARDTLMSSPVLSAVLCAPHHERSSFAATDGNIILIESGPQLVWNPDDQILIPAEVALILAKTEGFSIEKAENCKVARVVILDDDTARTTLVFRLVEGCFPAYRKALDAPANAQEIDGQTLIRAAALSGEGMAREQVEVVAYPSGTAPLTPDRGGRMVSAPIRGLPSAVGIDYRYAAIAATLNPSGMRWTLGRGIVGTSESLRILIMPIAMPDPDRRQDCSSGAPLPPLPGSTSNKAKPVQSDTIAGLRRQVEALTVERDTLSRRLQTLEALTLTT